ncbi:MAG: arsenate reductase (glutaredoxin) [Rhodocyclaceae bacterium]|nr:arsenate reductase (glutaredoxin) [Rhodocyclaceae bacterium]
MSEFVIYHNPRCGKSRSALALLRERGVEPEIVEYLKTPPDAATLARLLAALGQPAEQLLRKGEAVFKEKYKGESRDEAGWIEAMVADPILIERPIVVRGNRAVVGRPPEAVAALLD